MTTSGKDDPNTLLGDLESIRTLLDEAETANAETQPTLDNSDASDDDVPILDDVVTGAIELNEPEAATPLDLADNADTDSGVLDDDTFRALLDDEWRERAGSLLGAAREDIETNSELWQPDYTDELSEALQVRIDGVVHDWIATTLNNHIDGLRQALLTALQRELDDQLKRHLGASDSDPDEDTNAG